MNRGFYTLGSGMLTNNRSLSAISNNLANLTTIGYKKSQIQSATFGDMLMYRLDDNTTEIGSVSRLRSATQSYTIHSQGTLDTTDRTLDFAISGSGFFEVQSEDGVVYTRNGNFSINSDGYLVLNNVGRVLGTDGQPIRLGTDDFEADSAGNLFVDSVKVGQLAVADFADYTSLVSVNEGMYGANGQQSIASDAAISWKTLELSNAESAEEMTNAIAVQRNLQACAQALQIYDNNLAKAVAEIGKI